MGKIKSVVEFEKEISSADRRSIKDNALKLFVSGSPDRHNPDGFMSECYLSTVLTLIASKGYALIKMEDQDERKE